MKMMNPKTRKGIALFIVLLLTLVGGLISKLEPSAIAAEPGMCIDDWSIGAQVVKEKGLVSVAELTQQAKRNLPGSILKTKLCNTIKGFAYFVVIQTPNGGLKTVEINARHPFADTKKAR